jgi:hypothetical protein
MGAVCLQVRQGLSTVAAVFGGDTNTQERYVEKIYREVEEGEGMKKTWKRTGWVPKEETAEMTLNIFVKTVKMDYDQALFLTERECIDTEGEGARKRTIILTVEITDP